MYCFFLTTYSGLKFDGQGFYKDCIQTYRKYTPLHENVSAMFEKIVVHLFTFKSQMHWT